MLRQAAQKGTCVWSYLHIFDIQCEVCWIFFAGCLFWVASRLCLKVIWRYYYRRCRSTLDVHILNDKSHLLTIPSHALSKGRPNNCRVINIHVVYGTDVFILNITGNVIWKTIWVSKSSTKKLFPQLKHNYRHVNILAYTFDIFCFNFYIMKKGDKY